MCISAAVWHFYMEINGIFLCFGASTHWSVEDTISMTSTWTWGDFVIFLNIEASEGVIYLFLSSSYYPLSLVYSYKLLTLGSLSEGELPSQVMLFSAECAFLLF